MQCSKCFRTHCNPQCWYCSHCSKYGHQTKDCWLCTYCKKYGHKELSCRQKQRDSWAKKREVEQTTKKSFEEELKAWFIEENKQPVINLLTIPLVMAALDKTLTSGFCLSSPLTGWFVPIFKCTDGTYPKMTLFMVVVSRVHQASSCKEVPISLFILNSFSHLTPIMLPVKDVFFRNGYYSDPIQKHSDLIIINEKHITYQGRTYKRDDETQKYPGKICVWPFSERELDRWLLCHELIEDDYHLHQLLGESKLPYRLFTLRRHEKPIAETKIAVAVDDDEPSTSDGFR